MTESDIVMYHYETDPPTTTSYTGSCTYAGYWHLNVSQISIRKQPEQ